jgi:hypothetical protein
MQIVKQVWLMGAGLFVTLNLLNAAQLTAQPVAVSAEDVSTMVEAVAQTTPTPASEVPDNGRYYSAKTPDGPPMPGNMNFPAWNLGDNVWLLDDLKPTPASTSRSMTAMDISLPTDGGDDGDTNSGSYTPNANLSGYIPPNTNGLWLELTNYDGNFAYLNLHNGTNQVYAIWSTTNLPTGWQVETELWPVGLETNVFPFTVTALNRQNLFLRAEDWTGVDSNGDGIPDWWIWMYFGNLSETATNLDSQGNTLLYDYQNGLDPNMIQFSIAVTNNYVNSMSAPAQLNLSAGTPSYYAVSVDDTNYETDANWQAYAGANVMVYLGMTEGWHDVWIGLKGLPSNATPTWQHKRLKLDFTPPSLVVTNPSVSTVSVPLIQLQGYCSEALANISYDLSNAVGFVTNQDAGITGQFYSTNTFEFTTNYFEALDIPLTNGLNVITLHATDLAGNVTTTSLNYTLDYSSKTNPPTVQITWPQNGTQISGGSFTLDGQLADPTVNISVQMVSANGATNTVSGLVERNGKFWVENLPLSGGTNALTLTATDAVGNISTTNLTVVQSSLVLTMNPVTPDSQLWQPTVNLTGTISDATQAVWVNGVKGHNNGNGTWSASNVPTTAGGTASFTITAYEPTEQQPDGSYGN